MSASLLIYDIPENAGIKNPSWELRRWAFRINLSCWVIRTADIPYGLLGRMQKKGATWHAVKFDAGEDEKLVAMAVDAINSELQKAIDRGEASEGRAVRLGDRLEDSDARFRAYRKRSGAINRRLARMIKYAQEAAGRFGIETERFSLAAHMDRVNLLWVAMQRRARAYSEAAEKLAAESPGDPMAAALHADAVPAAVAADYIDDRKDGAGAELREAFAGE